MYTAQAFELTLADRETGSEGEAKGISEYDDNVETNSGNNGNLNPPLEDPHSQLYEEPHSTYIRKKGQTD